MALKGREPEQKETRELGAFVTTDVFLAFSTYYVLFAMAGSSQSVKGAAAGRSNNKRRYPATTTALFPSVGAHTAPGLLAGGQVRYS